MRVRKPDRKNAQSLIAASERRMRYTRSLALDEASASTIAGNVYECFRMLGDALLISRGIEYTDHAASIDALIRLDIRTVRSPRVLVDLKTLRHAINYYGYEPSIEQVEDVLSIADALFEPISERVERESDGPEQSPDSSIDDS